MSDELRAKDFEAVREQLGREPTVPFSVVARCSDGHPLVIRNRPVDAAGAPTADPAVVRRLTITLVTRADHAVSLAARDLGAVFTTDVHLRNR